MNLYNYSKAGPPLTTALTKSGEVISIGVMSGDKIKFKFLKIQLHPCTRGPFMNDDYSNQIPHIWVRLSLNYFRVKFHVIS